jgi:Fe-S cluster assembly protein SufD
MPELVNPAEKEQYLSDLKRLEGRPQPEWLRAIRETGAARFAELEFPHRRMEDWRFTNVNPIVSTRFESLTEPAASPTPDDVAPFLFHEEEWVELVFVDGFLVEALSRLDRVPQGVRAGSLAQAAAEGHPAVREHLARHAGTNGNVFSALNTAFLLDGAFVHVGARQAVENPIHLVFLSSAGRDNTANYPRNLIVVEQQSEATVLETYGALNGDRRYLMNAVSEIALGQDAQLNRCSVMQDSANGYHLSAVKVRQDRSSSFSSYTFWRGSKIGRNELRVALDGEGAECSLNGLYMTDGDQLIDNATAIEHVKPHCSSWIGYKGILDGHSSAVFSGKIYVHQSAQKTDSKQLNNNLLLSDTATIDTKPLLEIFADDVKCTHGATVGLPPEEIIFYFRSRGMSEAMARGMLTYGFADEVVNTVPVAALRDLLEKHVYERYSP